VKVVVTEQARSSLLAARNFYNAEMGGLGYEYDSALFDSAEIGKYAECLRQASNVVIVEPDVAAAFPNNAPVNNALRELLKLAKQVNVPNHA
jgi:hypothetical protein